MTETANAWLMDYRILRLVHQCRRLILSEFGEKLHLNDEALREQLDTYAGRTRCAGLQRVHAELQGALTEAQDPDEAPAPDPGVGTRRLYRGQPVHVEEKPSTDDQTEDAPKRRVVYRGSVV